MDTPAAPSALDRLSALPDSLLRNVLSCLTSRQAAQTSALSRRWRHLWHAVPCLDLDQREFGTATGPRATTIGAGACFLSASEDNAEWHRFEDLADRLSSLQHGAWSPPLDAFRLHLACDGFRAAADRWIRRGLGRRPAALHVRVDNFEGSGDAGWPCFPIDVVLRARPASTCRLTALRLSGLALTEGFGDALADGFPVLEDMRLEDCRCAFRRLASASLRRLDIEYHHRCCGGGGYGADELALTAPRLASLRVHGDPPPVAARLEMPSVVAATLERAAGDLGLLRSLRGAATLNLFRFSTTALLDDGDPGGFHVFGNLRTLLLDGCDVGAGCHAIRRFLRHAPSLEALTLRNCVRNRAFSGDAAALLPRRSRKRKARSKKKCPDDQRAPAPYPCKNLKLIEMEFYEDEALFELSAVLKDISSEVVHQIEGSVQDDGKRTVRITYK